jgi:spore coat polysaccharide biosynthesis protein SpsF (cytidylyltransferase family)
MGSGEPRPIVAIVQARMGSKRLPGKVLMDIEGSPMLLRVVERARRAQTLDRIGVATTDLPTDDAVAEMCARQGIDCFRGSSVDVLDRFYRAALAFHAAVVVRLTGDCPLIDPGVIDQTVRAFLESDADFAANRLPEGRTFPVGLDTEVCSLAALERAWREASAAYEREHVMPFLYDPPGRFRVLQVHAPVDLGHLRWTVDTPQDLEFVRGVFAAFAGNDHFTWMQVADLVARDPGLAARNAGVPHRRHTDAE